MPATLGNEYTPLISGICLAQIDLRGGVQSFVERVADRPWAAAIELLLIGAVVYAILAFFQGTRGTRLVRAVLIILGASFAVTSLIAERFEFERINVLYPYFMLGVFLVSLVAFQTELRRMLLRLGQGGWLQRWLLKNSDPVTDPILAAVERLSKKKVGALIAIARTAEMGPFAETGVQLDAAVSAELLETIFWPGTPLHDLGVIVNNGRIVAAGCQFPLAESGDLDRSLGSRHRAALGMSQEVDAVVLVVSEETGAISLAARGRLWRALKIDALRASLIRELTTRSMPPETARPAGTASSSGKVAHDGTGQTA